MRALAPLAVLLMASPTAAQYCNRDCAPDAPRDIYGCCASEDDGCRPGMVRNEDTAGECCWEGQAWSVLQQQCKGVPTCPDGMVARGEDCVEQASAAPAAGPDPCAEGQVSSFGHCCWPGQIWENGGCVGVPRCPAGFEVFGTDCTPRAYRPPPEQPVTYVPVAPGDYVRIEPGKFDMGSPRGEPGRFINEKQRTVTITRPFMMKATEVTQGEWLRLVGRNPAYATGCGTDCPVERVSWYEALAWLNRLSDAEGLPSCYVLSGCSGTLGGGCRGTHCGGDYVCSTVRFEGLDCPGYRLPTEAEWEYAARAGTDTSTWAGAHDFRGRNHAPVLDDIAWYAGNSGAEHAGAVDCSTWPERSIPAALCGPHDAGQKKANPWGLHDVLGNVSEWVWDAFGRFNRQARKDPVQNNGAQRVIRGGSWASAALEVRAALRPRLPAAGRNYLVGFRPVRTLVPGVEPKPKKPAAAPDAGSADAATPDAGVDAQPSPL